MTNTNYSALLSTQTAETFEEIAALDSEALMPTYKRQPVAFVRGEGMELVDTKGRHYLDFLAGIGTVGLGHSHPVVIDALMSQAKKLMHASNIFHVEQRGELASDLCALMGAPAQAFFSNSGAEANECAIKLARKWAHAHKPEADTIITMRGSFHGRTLATVAATGQEKFSAPFTPKMPGFESVPFNDIAALEAAVGEKTIAIMLEPILGESGVWPATRAYFDAIGRLCKQHGCLLIVDEVQSGMFRTGAPYAYQHYGADPDIITLAKGIGNGFPLGATLAKREIAQTFVPGDHGTTFGGNALAVAVARTVVRELAALADSGHIDRVSAYAFEKLSAIPHVTDVRGKGLMIGFTVEGITAAELSALMLEKGCIINAIGERYIRILPPLICDIAHIDALTEALYAIMSEKDKEI